VATKVIERHAHPKYSRLTVQLRSDSKFYQAVTYLDGKLRQTSTKTPQLPAAFKLAEDWYKRELRASVAFGRQHPIAQLTADPTVGEVFKSYLHDLPKAKQPYALQKWGPIQHFWRAKLLSHVTPTLFKDFYTWRRSTSTVSNHTLHKDVVLLRQVLKFALHDELLPQLPHIPPTGKIDANPRPWLTPDEWKHLIAVSQTRIDAAHDQNQIRVVRQRADLHQFIQMMVATMCRVDELRALRYVDCRIERDGRKRPTALIAQITGKTGSRPVKAPREAAHIILDRQARLGPKPELLQRVFPVHHRDAFRELLIAANLRTDHDGHERNFKSLRATAISFRILNSDEPNLLNIARNAGTSVTMIDQFYAKRLTALHDKGALSSSLTLAGATLE
jgi:integrase